MKKNVFSRNFLDSQVKTVGYIVYATRMSAKLGQVDVAKKLNVTQSYLSKIESGIMAPSLFFWFDFCETFNIDKDAISNGYLGGIKLSEIKHSNVENGFKLIKKTYQPNRCMTTRQMLPFFNLMSQLRNGDFTDEFIAQNFIHPSFFINLDNQLNLKLANDILVEGTKALSEDVENLFSTLNKNLLGFLPENRRIDSWDKAIGKLVSYQKIFNYEIDTTKKELDIAVRLNSEIQNDFLSCDERTAKYFEMINIDLIPNHFDHSMTNFKSYKQGSFVKGDKEIHLSLAI